MRGILVLLVGWVVIVLGVLLSEGIPANLRQRCAGWRPNIDGVSVPTDSPALVILFSSGLLPSRVGLESSLPFLSCAIRGPPIASLSDILSERFNWRGVPPEAGENSPPCDLSLKHCAIGKASNESCLPKT